MREKFDAIVVGAGPSGNAAAYTLAKAGLKVLQIERGEYPGSKNVQGAILYSDALEKIIPDFREDAPLERHIIEQRMWVLDNESFVGSHFRSDNYNKPPFNRYTILRAQFDKWFSQKVREAGALLICETTVEHLLMDGERVVGVRCDREGGDVFADVVVLADGVNSTLARKAGFHD
ncbi:MAG TPA: FAD-dependent oxidoreductase, partial [Burkholderiaceae bacterium]|nr:FAD-dependent oxidoreductase [Burkholderiaceae bacterium]